MGKKTKTLTKSTKNIEECKEKLWELFLRYGDLATAQENMDQETVAIFDKIAAQTLVEVPAFKVSITVLRDFLENNCYSDEIDNCPIGQALQGALKPKSLDVLFAYHESEMQRHAEAAAAISKGERDGD